MKYTATQSIPSVRDQKTVNSHLSRFKFYIEATWVVTILALTLLFLPKLYGPVLLHRKPSACARARSFMPAGRDAISYANACSFAPADLPSMSLFPLLMAVSYTRPS